MANSYSSDSDIELDAHDNANSTIKPYDYQPKKRRIIEKSPVDSDTSNTSDSDESDQSDNSPRREGNTNWCKCGKCQHVLLVREKEFVCCQERFKTRSYVKACEEGKMFLYTFD